MAIHFDLSNEIFHLQSKDSSYLIQIVRGYPVHLYWGKKLRHTSSLNSLLDVVQRSAASPNPIQEDKRISLDSLPQEYPQFGTSDFRGPAYQIELADGTRISELRYMGHRIMTGKPRLDGLPSVYVESLDEAETLILELYDDYCGLRVELIYTVFAHEDVITRSVRFVNSSEAPIQLLRALSASVDFHDDEYDFLYLQGATVRERHVMRRQVAAGSTRIESRRGSSGHQLNPFAAIMRKDANEDQGEVFGFSLVYSGNFVIEAEVDHYENTRVSAGINPFNFEWRLEPGQSFQTPEVVMVYSNQGLGEMSRTYHRLYRTRLSRGVYRDKERPVLVNNWEATYFDFDADKLVSIAQAGAELGIELFVLDDGWFGKRDDDKSSLGDWFVDLDKLPDGLDDLAKRVNELGMRFGLWVEPEMISPDSNLYREHPDWCLHVPGRRRTMARNQLMLDLSREDVRVYLYRTLKELFGSAPISYVKWDMNRNMTEAHSAAAPADRQSETAHRYMLGLYELLEKLTADFPGILFESCAAGGGRFDPGMLYYMPQTWTSDNSDAVERLKIQYGTSLVYPVSAMGAHVSAVPNHQVKRTTSFEFRGAVAMSGNFGYELDLSKLSDKEKELAKGQIAEYKELRGLIQQGDLYRLKSPFEGNETAWMFVSRDKMTAVVYHFRVLAEPNAPLRRLVLKGLNPALDYTIEGLEGQFAGDLLMQGGLPHAVFHGDFSYVSYKLKAKQ